MSDQPTKTESELSDDIAALDNARVADDQQPDATEAETAETESGAAETTATAAEAREAPETSETVDAVEAITEAAEPETEQAEPVDDAVNAADAKTEAEHANESETHTDATAAPADVSIKFEELALPKPLLKAITKLGFEECTPIQGRSLPFSLSDYDVTGQAQTGTGKTAAFLITLLTRFWENPPQERPNLGIASSRVGASTSARGVPR